MFWILVLKSANEMIKDKQIRDAFNNIRVLIIEIRRYDVRGDHFY